MMSSCDNHSDCIVVFEGYKCPVCMDEKYFEGQIDEANDEIARLENELDEAVNG